MWDEWVDLMHGGRCHGCAAPGRVLCRQCELLLPRGARPHRPHPCPPGMVPGRVSGDYDQLLKTLVNAHKEQAAFGLATHLGFLVAQAAAHWCRGQQMLLVPVPSRPGVVRRRSHDPVLRMTRAAAHWLRRAGSHVQCVELLWQRLPAADHAGLSSGDRFRNRVETMAVRPEAREVLVRLGRVPTVVICDDVITTGATVVEAQRALAAHGLGAVGAAAVAGTQRRVV